MRKERDDDQVNEEISDMADVDSISEASTLSEQLKVECKDR